MTGHMNDAVWDSEEALGNALKVRRRLRDLREKGKIKVGELRMSRCTS